ncbi:hypothetical protein BRETT_001861 [Brettanomyces bruxellensis]|uniref:Uncharacterized protein n=1 Tax=Dekkera bruxellensis TaxID=5007 RepID=A0A871R859_DEKBR|nr:uncharacterized protein BRETT_001861 [Brettanomyces bruxellensis]QOU18791.1 hypothetical protein BRETT_001861 [Brettanomyces bruxellensis]
MSEAGKLESTVDLFESCLSFAEEATQSIDAATKEKPDFGMRRVFDVVSESTLKQKTQLVDNYIKPQLVQEVRDLNELVELYEKKKKNLEKQHEVLRLKIENAESS